VRHAGALPIPPTFAGQEPLGFDADDFDEAEEHHAGDGRAGFVTGQGASGDLKGLGQERPAMFAIPVEADRAKAGSQELT
jgi:hypothetical protein